MNAKSKLFNWVLALALLLTALPLSASADRDPRGGWRGGGDSRHFSDRDHDHWRGGGDFRHFGDRDFDHWRAGHWRHDYHDGRWGWWWIVGANWYFYPQWVAGYPDPYLYTPPPVVVAQPAPPAPITVPATQYWYYCDAAKAYYPYVSSCPGGWRMVPAAPPAPPVQ